MDTELSEFISRIKERYGKSSALRRIVFELNKTKNPENKWLLWQELEDELS
jgi:hypothetical protein